MQDQISTSGQNAQQADYRLLLDRMQTKLLAGDDQDRICWMLGRQDIWSGLDVDSAVQWARLALMAGKTDIALFAGFRTFAPAAKRPYAGLERAL